MRGQSMSIKKDHRTGQDESYIRILFLSSVRKDAEWHSMESDSVGKE